MFGFFIIRKLFDISCISDHVQPISKPFSVVLAECDHFAVTWSVQEFLWSLGLCRKIPAQSCFIMWSRWSQQNEAQKRPGISTLNSLSTVQFNVPQKCYEFKTNTELLKTRVNAMNTL